MDLKCMCVNCHTNQQKQEASNKNGAQKDLDKSNVFNPPDDHHLKTADLYGNEDIPERFKNCEIIKGYGFKAEGYHPFYRTTNSDYGAMPPKEHSFPNCYFARTYEFSKSLAKSGMYRNHSLNTVMDKSHV